jgi:pimeloyl-ACP methyl ester carboxylesterase
MIAALLLQASAAQPVSHTLTVSGAPVHLMHAGDPALPPVLFVHGSPGSWGDWRRWLSDGELQARAHLIALDRPGYGDSSPGAAEPSMARQADAALAALSVNTSGLPAIVVGHSLGGPIAARLAMDHPERVSGLLLLAASIAPELEAPRWYNRLAAALPWLPRDLRTSNDELLPLADELREMLSGWSAITARTVLLQGDRDRLVYPQSAAFAARMMPDAEVTLIDGAGHMLPWREVDTVRAALWSLLDAAGG